MEMSLATGLLMTNDLCLQDKNIFSKKKDIILKFRPFICTKNYVYKSPLIQFVKEDVRAYISGACGRAQRKPQCKTPIN